MAVKINIYFLDLTDEEIAILESDMTSINSEVYLSIPEDPHTLWYTLDALLKINSKRLFDMILTAHIKDAVYRNELSLNRLARALKLGE